MYQHLIQQIQMKNKRHMYMYVMNEELNHAEMDQTRKC